MTNYTIQAGDNLTKIAKAHNTTVSELAKINNISDPNKINAGVVIKFTDDPKPVEAQPADSFKELQDTLIRTEKQYLQLQEQMQQQKTNLSSTEMFGIGLAGAAVYKVGEKALPYAWKGAKNIGQDLYLKGLYAKDGIKNGAKNVANKIEAQSKHLAKKVELEYAFGKDAAKQGAKNVANATVNTSKKVAKFSKKTNVRANRILNGQQTTINGKGIKLSKAGKLLGKAAVPLTIATSLFEVGTAYERGGVKEATKTGAKCATGVAAGWAGAKVGAAIGTAICPGIGTAIGGFIGGIGGYLLGEKAAEKIIS